MLSEIKIWILNVNVLVHMSTYFCAFYVLISFLKEAGVEATPVGGRGGGGEGSKRSSVKNVKN